MWSCRSVSGRSGSAASSGSCAGAAFCRCTLRRSTDRSGASSSAARRRGRPTDMAEIHRPHAHAPVPADGALENVTVHHEESDVDIRGILGFGAGLVVVAVVIHLLMWVLLGFFESRAAKQPTRAYPLAATQENRLPPEPRLQTNPREDMAELRARENAQLQSYGWVDKNAGVVRIPIDAAIKLTLQRGLPARQETKP